MHCQCTVSVDITDVLQYEVYCLLKKCSHSKVLFSSRECLKMTETLQYSFKVITFLCMCVSFQSSFTDSLLLKCGLCNRVYNIVQSNTTIIIILFIGLGRHVSIPLESSSGPSTKIYRSFTIYWTRAICFDSIGIIIRPFYKNIQILYIFIEGPDDDSNGIETCRPSPINNTLMIVVID